MYECNNLLLVGSSGFGLKCRSYVSCFLGADIQGYKTEHASIP